MTKIESRIRSYVSRHKKAVAGTVAAFAVIGIQHRAIKSAHTFIDDEGLTDKYLDQFTLPEDVE